MLLRSPKSRRSRGFDIPYQPLLGRVRGRKPKYRRPSTNNVVEPEQEKALIYGSIPLDHAFFPPSSAGIHEAAEHIIQRYDPSRTLGKNWAYNFLARTPPRFDWNTQKQLKEQDIKPQTLVL